MWTGGLRICTSLNSWCYHGLRHVGECQGSSNVLDRSALSQLDGSVSALNLVIAVTSVDSAMSCTYCMYPDVQIYVLEKHFVGMKM